MEKTPIGEFPNTKEELGTKVQDIEKDLDHPATTLLHVYHHNREKSKSYAIHTLRDSSTPITFPEKKSKKKNKKSKEDTPATPLPYPPQHEDSKTQTERPGLLKRISTQAARAKAYDNPKLDPRCSPPSPPPPTSSSNLPNSSTQTTSYFLHLPTLYFHCPPYTLRKGGNKRAPVTALITPGCLWREWKLEFGDVLREEGVIDGRGVVSSWAGTRDGKEGFLRGYANRKRRWWGESGKKWFYEQKQKQEVGGGGDGNKLEEEEKERERPRKPEEVVNVKWVAPLKRAREYRFQWRGFEFVWKGTGMVGLPDKKFAQFRSATTRFSHLKLVVVVPHPKARVINGEGEEIVLARYTSTMAKRKAGRLEVSEEAVDGFVASHGSSLSSPPDISSAPSPFPKTPELGVDDNTSKSNEKQNPFEDPDSPKRDLDKIRERLKDLVVASGMCMVIGEFEKREVLYAILLLFLEAAQNGGG